MATTKIQTKPIQRDEARTTGAPAPVRARPIRLSAPIGKVRALRRWLMNRELKRSRSAVA